MAEETIEEVQEAPIAEKAEAAEGKSSKKIPILVIIPIVAILSFILITKIVNPRLAAAGDPTTQKVKKKKKKESYIHEIGSVVANPSKGDSRRIMKVTASVEATSKNTLKILEREQAMLNHLFLMTVSSKTIALLSTAKGKADLREELRQVFAAELGLEDDDLSNVYFSEFVMQ